MCIKINYVKDYVCPTLPFEYQTLTLCWLHELPLLEKYRLKLLGKQFFPYRLDVFTTIPVFTDAPRLDC